MTPDDFTWVWMLYINVYLSLVRIFNEYLGMGMTKYKCTSYLREKRASGSTPEDIALVKRVGWVGVSLFPSCQTKCPVNLELEYCAHEVAETRKRRYMLVISQCGIISERPMPSE